MRTLILTAFSALFALARCSSSAALDPLQPSQEGAEHRLESLRFYLAVPLDQQGKLAEALPLYRVRAQQTRTTADRLRYAGALLRSGRADEAQAIHDQLMKENGSIEHGGDQLATNAGVIASSLLLNGFPMRAVPYARAAHRAHPREASYALLAIRALCASGDTNGARALIAAVAGNAGSWTANQQIELARWYLSTGDVAAARKLLAAEVGESLAQMYRDAILALVAFRSGDWPKATDALAGSINKAPPSLSDGNRVGRAWRNAQREIRTIYLRRAISRWQEGKRELAVADAVKAQASDEEYIRSGAIILRSPPSWSTIRPRRGQSWQRWRATTLASLRRSLNSTPP